MKKQIYLLPVLGLILAGCAAEDPMADGQDSNQTPVVNKYLTINVIPANGGTRADAPENYPNANQPGEDENDELGFYIDGTGIENNVSAVRFYFFTENGSPSPVWENAGTATPEYESFIDWYPNPEDLGGPTHNMTVEKILTATLGLTTPGEGNYPASVVAVLNPTAQLKNYKPAASAPAGESYSLIGPSLEQLRTQVNDYYTDLHGDGINVSSGNFVMSNSVYVVTNEENGEQVKSVMDYTPLDEETNFKNTPEEAAENAVEIYVERVLARLDFSLNLSNETTTAKDGVTTLYKVSEQSINEEDPDNEGSMTTPEDATDVYVKLLGWNLSAVLDESRLLKNVNPNWTSNQLFGNSLAWNAPQYFRSFWAMNPNGITDSNYQYGNFGFGTTPGQTVEGNAYPMNSLPIPGTGAFTTTYLQENASPYPGTTIVKTGNPTKVVIAAQLVNSDGDPISLAEFNYKKYTLESLKVYLANNILNQLYIKQTNSDGSPASYTKIKPENLTYATREDINTENSGYGITIPESNPDYYVYIVLNVGTDTENGQVPANTVWTEGKDNDDAPTMTNADINAYILRRANHAMVWNTGYTYYYIDVRHLGADGSPARWGIVRNHIYNTNITGITGLGTPVYDPDLVIIPTKPEYNESIIMAKINILQWRIVSEDYNINW